MMHKNNPYNKKHLFNFILISPLLVGVVYAIFLPDYHRTMMRKLVLKIVYHFLFLLWYLWLVSLNLQPLLRRWMIGFLFPAMGFRRQPHTPIISFCPVL